MSQSYLDKLRQLVRRYNNKDFLNAAIAVCALSAIADDEVALDELYRIDQLILDDPALQEINAKKARQKLKEFLKELTHNRAESPEGACRTRSTAWPKIGKKPTR